MAVNPFDIQSSASFNATNSTIPSISSVTPIQPQFTPAINIPQNSWWDTMKDKFFTPAGEMISSALRLGYTPENPKVLGMTPDVFSALAGGLASALAPPQFGPTGQYIGPSAPGQVGALMQQRAQSNMLMQMLKEAIGKKQSTVKEGEGTELEPFNEDTWLSALYGQGGKL